MTRRPLLLPAFLAACAATPAAAQTRRVVTDLQLWPELQAELALKNGDYLFVAAHGEIVPAYFTQPYRDHSVVFTSKTFGAAYEHFWSEYWSGGATLQYTPGDFLSYVVPELLLRHRGPAGPVTFGQRLGLYRSFPTGNPSYDVAPEAQTWISLRADIEKLFPLGGGKVALRPRISYEAATHLRLQKATDDEPDERTIQFTSLRGEVGCRVGNHFDFTPWVAYMTSYYFTIGYSPIAGSPPINAGRLNLTTPVVGFDARFTLFVGGKAFDRKQLPTQH